MLNVHSHGVDGDPFSEDVRDELSAEYHCALGFFLRCHDSTDRREPEQVVVRSLQLEHVGQQTRVAHAEVR